MDEEKKKSFWEFLDEVVRGVPNTEKVFLGGDFNGYNGSSPRGYDGMYGGVGFGERNKRGALFLDFARSFWLMVESSSFL